jgi:hypothetical protein
MTVQEGLSAGVRALRTRVWSKSTVPLAKPAENDGSRAAPARKGEPYGESQMRRLDLTIREKRRHNNIARALFSQACWSS